MVFAHTSKKPQKKRFWIPLVILVVFGIWFSTSYIYSYVANPNAFRIGIAIIADPIIIVSWNPRNNTLVAMRLPGSARVQVAYGYGMYSITSLSELDRQEKKHGLLVRQTLEDVVGFPIHYFLRFKEGPPVLTESDRSTLQSIFSLPSFVRMIQGQIETNIPLFTFFHFYRVLGSIPTFALTSYDFVQRNVVTKETLPDGSESFSIDPNRIDLLFGNILEDERLRKENFRVAVVNATEKEGLAQRVARNLDKSGLSIVSLSNIDTSVDTCRIEGHASIKDSLTVRFVTHTLGCPFAAHENTSLDATILVGEAFAKR